MEFKAKNRRHESSLLLQPRSLMAWDSTPGNVLMPLAVSSYNENESHEDNQEEQENGQANRTNKPLVAPSIPERYVSDTRYVPQLQQPLTPCQSVHTATNLSLNSATDEESEKMFYPPPLQPTAAGSQLYSQSAYMVPNVSTYQHCLPCPSRTHVPMDSSEPATVIPTHNSETGFNPASNQVSSENSLLANSFPEVFVYQPVKPHWFYNEIVEEKELWYGFSHMDCKVIEKAYQHALEHDAYNEAIVVPVVGGRYDVYIQQREKVALYWSEKTASVRRCTWFHKVEGSQRFVPFDEAAANSIEEMYKKCASSGQWHQKVLLNGGDSVLMEGPNTVYYCAPGLDVWPTIVEMKTVPQISVRGVPPNAIILTNESMQIDHLVFVVQGIGSFCDLSFRTVYQCVDGVRDIANSLIPVHFKSEYENNAIGRVEFLPLAWHASLHTDDVGFDRKMKSITLPSIPKLRYFTNDALLDILLYSSPMYCQAIIDTVTNSLNRLYHLFLSRNSQFIGQVSVAGHSLGSLILFDILSNQTFPESKPDKSSPDKLDDIELHDINLSNVECSRRSSLQSVSSSESKKQPVMSIESVFESLALQDYLEIFLKEKIDLESLMYCGDTELKDLGLPMGPRKKVLTFIKKHGTQEHSAKIVELVDEATDSLTPESFPSHSISYFSPAVYPCKPLYPLSSVKFPRLEFNPACFFALGSPIAMFLAVRGYTTISEDFCFPTCPSFFHIFHPYDPVAFRMEPLIDPKFSEKPVLIPHHKGRKRMHLEIRENIAKMGFEFKQKFLETLKFTWSHINKFSKGGNISTEAVEAEVNKLVQEQIRNQIDEDYQEYSENLFIGKLNRGRRIDYVLQEKPIEALNEYIFALTSHATYWNSEDTLLMILKEVYAAEGILPKSSESKESIVKESYQQSLSAFSEAQDDNTEAKSYLTSVDACSENKMKTSCLPQSLVVNNNVNTLSSESLYSIDSTSTHNVTQASFIPPQPLGPPPLSGFVKKSPFNKP